jgi:hypothetical protein
MQRQKTGAINISAIYAEKHGQARFHGGPIGAGRDFVTIAG